MYNKTAESNHTNGSSCYKNYDTRQPSDGMPFGKIDAIFSAVSYLQNPARRQCQQNQGDSYYADFPTGRKHRVPAQVFLHADESTSRHAAVRQGYVLPFHEFLPYEFWHKFTTLLVSSIIWRSIEPLTDEKRRNVLIIDGSIFSWSRSKKVELLVQVFDHAHGLYTFGFHMLTLECSDNNTFSCQSAIACCLQRIRKTGSMNLGLK